MTKDEALKLALEALESGADAQVGRVVWTEYDSCLMASAITAIKEALAQPEQEPMFNWLPEHKCVLYLTHNEHRDYYQTVEECYYHEDFVSEDEWLKAIKEDSVWVLQWYPNTPIGFTRIAASTLLAIQQWLKEGNT